MPGIYKAMLEKINMVWQNNYAAITFAAFFVGVGVLAALSGDIPSITEAQTFYAAVVAFAAAFFTGSSMRFAARHKEDREDDRAARRRTESQQRAAEALATVVFGEVKQMDRNFRAIHGAKISYPVLAMVLSLAEIHRFEEQPLIQEIMSQLPGKSLGKALRFDNLIGDFLTTQTAFTGFCDLVIARIGSKNGLGVSTYFLSEQDAKDYELEQLAPYISLITFKLGAIISEIVEIGFELKYIGEYGMYPNSPKSVEYIKQQVQGWMNIYYPPSDHPEIWRTA